MWLLISVLLFNTFDLPIKGGEMISFKSKIIKSDTYLHVTIHNTQPYDICVRDSGHQYGGLSLRQGEHYIGPKLGITYRPHEHCQIIKAGKSDTYKFNLSDAFPDTRIRQNEICYETEWYEPAMLPLSPDKIDGYYAYRCTVIP